MMYSFYEIKCLRKECKIKQYELAKLLGIEQSNYANIENGRLIPKNLGIIKFRAKSILLPKLDDLIKDKKMELYSLEWLKELIYKK